MPPKVDVKTLAGKMENALNILYEFMEEFETIFSVTPELKTLEAVFTQVETRYKLIIKQQETILDRLVDEGTATDEEEPFFRPIYTNKNFWHGSDKNGTSTRK